MPRCQSWVVLGPWLADYHREMYREWKEKKTPNYPEGPVASLVGFFRKKNEQL